jgi:hypothetical protein
VKEGFAPFAGRYPIASRQVDVSVGGGVDIMRALGRRTLFFPVRVSRRISQAVTPTSLAVQVGVGLSFRTRRRLQ